MTTQYTIRVGKEEITFEGPDNMTPEQITALGDSVLRDAKPGQEFPHSVYVPQEKPVAADEVPIDPSESSAGGAALRGAKAGLFSNFDDEIAAFGNAAGLAGIDNALGTAENQQAFWDNPEGFWAAYENNLNQQDKQAEADKALHPRARLVGTIGGAVAQTVLGAKAAGAALGKAGKAGDVIKAAMNANPVKTGAAVGAASGAAAGAGDSRGNRAQGAALGGAGGAVLGGAISGAFQFAPWLVRYGKTLLNKGVTQEALGQIQKAMARDGLDVTSPTGLQKLRDALSEFTGKPVSLADLGSASRARAGVGLRVPNAAQNSSIDAITERTAGQGPRLAEDVRRTVSPRTDVEALDDALIQQRADMAKQLREKALFEDGVTSLPPKGEVMYYGGAKLDPSHKGPTFFTPDKAAAQTYADAHASRFGAPGILQEVRLNSQNPAPYDVVKRYAVENGMAPSEVDNLLPASIFDPILHGQGGAKKVTDLISSLRREGYDSARLPDLAFGQTSGDPIEALIPFDLSSQIVPETLPVTGRVSRMVDDPVLNQLARLPMAQKALQRAQAVATAERDRLASLGQSIDHLPDYTPGGDIDMRGFDYLKRFLDDEVNRLYKRGDTSTFSAAEANEVRQLRDSIRERLREYNPDYADYLDAYAGSSEIIDSLGEGLKFDKSTPFRISAEQTRRSEAGQELYRTGVARNLVDRLNKTPDNAQAALRILRSPEERQLIEASGVPKDKLDDLWGAVQRERQMGLLSNELTGAQTAQRMAAQADADAGANLQVPFNPGSPIGWLGMGARSVINRVTPARNAAVNEELLPRMISTDPQVIENTITELMAAGRMQEAMALQRAARSRGASFFGGGRLGTGAALPSNQEGY